MMRSRRESMLYHLEGSARDIYDSRSRRAKLGASAYLQPCGSSTQSTIGDKLRDWASLLSVVYSEKFTFCHRISRRRLP